MKHHLSCVQTIIEEIFEIQAETEESKFKFGLIQNSIREKQITNDLTALLVKAIRNDLDDKDRSDDLWICRDLRTRKSIGHTGQYPRGS